MRLAISVAAAGLALAISVTAVSTQQPIDLPEIQTAVADEGLTGGTAPEAPAGFTLTSNGFSTAAEFAEALAEFSSIETPADGLGPMFNNVGCATCHSVPITGGSTQVTERRAGKFDGTTFFEHPGGSLIQDRSLNVSFQEMVAPGSNVIALRSSLSILGDGFVEAISNTTLTNIRNAQPVAMRGLAVAVPVLEAPGQTRIGRFGHKGQQASLLSFAADAYNNEMGITSPLQPRENGSNLTPVCVGSQVPTPSVPCVPDPLPGEPTVPDDDGDDVELFATFMRSTLAPPVDAARAATLPAARGRSLFTSLGCATCHTATIVTAPAGTLINGGAFTVHPALGNKTIHPYSDFLLHDIGTGDGIVQNGGSASRLRVRTVPLWGLRVRGRFMHDANSHSPFDAIQRHGGEASSVRSAYNGLSASDRDAVIVFLLSL